MKTLEEVEALAFALPEAERETLISHLLGSLESSEMDLDGQNDNEEAIQRLKDFERDPSIGIPAQEFETSIRREFFT